MANDGIQDTAEGISERVRSLVAEAPKQHAVASTDVLSERAISNTGRILAWAALGAATISVLVRGGKHDWVSGDTVRLISGLPEISRCLGDGVFSACNAHLRSGHVSAFPLLQMMPGYVLHVAGVSDKVILGALSWLNALVTVAMCVGVVHWFHRWRGRRPAILAALLLLPGMLIPYTADTFGEPLAAAAFGGLCLAALRADRTSPWLLPFAFAATVSKDTAAPFVVLLALACIVLSSSSAATARRSVAMTLLGTTLGVVAVVVFNVFRYGGPTNTEYLQFPSASTGMLLNNAVGLLVSPNGGITWFWPGVSIATGILVAAFTRGSTTDLRRRIRVSAVLALSALAGSIAVLADWWQPYGWYAWGPRLLVPIAPAIIIVAVAVTRRDQAARWFAPLAATALALIAVVALAPSIGIVFHPQVYVSQINDTLHRYHDCTTLPRAEVPGSVWERCLRHDAWGTSQMPLFQAVPRSINGHFWYWSTMASVALTSLLWARIGVRSSAHEVAPVSYAKGG